MYTDKELDLIDSAIGTIVMLRGPQDSKDLFELHHKVAEDIIDPTDLLHIR